MSRGACLGFLVTLGKSSASLRKGMAMRPVNNTDALQYLIECQWSLFWLCQVKDGWTKKWMQLRGTKGCS